MNRGQFGFNKGLRAGAFRGLSHRRYIDYPILGFESIPGIAQALFTVSTGNAISYCFKAPRTGSIDAAWVSFSSVSGSPTIQVGLEGVVARAPDGTYKAGGNAFASLAPPTSSSIQTNLWRSFGTPAFVTAGDLLAVTVRYISGLTSATVRYGYFNGGVVRDAAFNFPAYFTAAVWTPEPGFTALAARYTDGTIVGTPTQGSLVNWSNATNPQYVGTAWTCPMDCLLDRVIIPASRTDASGDDQMIECWENGNPRPFASFFMDQSELTSLSSAPSILYFPSDQPAKAGSVYRATIRPLTATSSQRVMAHYFNSSKDRDAYGAGRMKYTTAQTPGNWTDTDNAFATITFGIKSIVIPSGTP